jgi:deoxyribodipyrimidine photo-lyase
MNRQQEITSFMQTQVVIFFRNLRVQHNQALASALAKGPTIGIYLTHPSNTDLNPTSASNLWLEASLNSLQTSLALRSVPLKLLSTTDALKLISLTPVTVHAAASNEAWYKEFLAAIPQNQLSIYHENYLLNPASYRTAKGAPFVVYSQFFEHVKNVSPTVGSQNNPHGTALPVTQLFPKKPLSPWQLKLQKYVHAGEDSAHTAFSEFLSKVSAYPVNRDIPFLNGTSRLSTALHFGEISVHYMLETLIKQGHLHSVFHKELVWRDYANYLLHHFPYITHSPFDLKFTKFPWTPNPVLVDSWKKGVTGYPIVDAGMRELWATGHMHNRVRMITASLLVKHMLQPWQVGQAWFQECLFDHDEASNAMNWQWVAGCGIDAAPFFRIFSPELQSKRFDPSGLYIKKWVPELSSVPVPQLYKLPTLPPAEIKKLSIIVGKDYPTPVVDYTEGRNKALAAFNSLKS